MHPIPPGQDCVSLKKTARVAFTACHLLATRDVTFFFFFFFFPFYFSHFNYSRVNVNCERDRLGELHSHFSEGNGSILISSERGLPHDFEVTTFSRYLRVLMRVYIAERRYERKGVKRWRDCRGKRMETRGYDTSS